MKTFKPITVGGAIFIALACVGCANTEQASAPSRAKVAARPTLEPTPTPTSTGISTRVELAERQAIEEQSREEARARGNAAYDVPALLGNTIEQVRAMLGPVEGSGDDDDGEMSWSNSKGALLVEYRISTRQITSFFINDKDDRTFTDRKRFLVMGNLREDDPNYTLKFIPLAGSTREWMGVRIIPK